MMKYNIGFDLDSCLVSWLVSPEKQAAFNLGIKDYPEQYDWDYSNFTEPHRQEIFKLFRDPNFMGITNIIFDPMDKRTLMIWKEEGHKLILITSRKPSVVEATQQIINEYFPEIDKVYIVGSIDNKKEIMIQENLDYWIDDSPKGINISMELGLLGSFLIYNNKTSCYNQIAYDKYWNKDNFFPVRSIYEVYNYV